MEPLAQVDDWPVDAVAVGVTDAERTLNRHGPCDRRFALASVTKPLAALATLVAVEGRYLDLDEPAGPEGATVRHLLAHASGLPFEAGAPTQTPGRRRVYSNLGFELLGELVSERVGAPFATHLYRAVLEPLGMSSTRLDGSPAHAAVGSIADLLVFARELLQPTLVSADLHAQACAVAFPGLDGVLPGYGRQSPNDWGLGFEIRDHKRPHWTGTRNSPATFGHFGRAGSFLWVDPAAGIACVCLADRDFGPWAVAAWPPLSDAVVDAYGVAGDP